MSLVVPGLGRTVTKRPTGAVPSPTEGDTTYAGGSKDFDENTGRYRNDGGTTYAGGSKNFDESTGRYRNDGAIPYRPIPSQGGKPGPKEYKDHLRRMKEEKMRRRQKGSQPVKPGPGRPGGPTA